MNVFIRNTTVPFMNILASTTCASGNKNERVYPQHNCALRERNPIDKQKEGVVDRTTHKAYCLRFLFWCWAPADPGHTWGGGGGWEA
jgi:hypothetical protein